MKILKWIMKAVVALVTIITLIVLFADDLEHTYNKLTWTPPMEINGITTGMTKSDVVFKLGENVECLDGIIVCSWANQLVFFENEIVEVINSIDDLRESLRCCLPVVNADVGLGVSSGTLSIEWPVGSEAVGGVGRGGASSSGSTWWLLTANTTVILGVVVILSEMHYHSTASSSIFAIS